MPLVCHLVGAAPTLVKIAPLARALAQRGVEQRLVHTGRADDLVGLESLLEDLRLSLPEVHLGVSPNSPLAEAAGVLLGMEHALPTLVPVDWMVVPGHSNMALAAAFAAMHHKIKVAHLEAGLRSGDRSRPGELRRILLDQVAEILFTASARGDDNLVREGIAASRIARIGSTLVDSLLSALPRSRERAVPEQLGLVGGGYALCSLHRREIVEVPPVLKAVLSALAELSRRLPVVFLVHPWARAQLSAAPLARALAALKLAAPFGYLDFVSLLAEARLVLTDSGGLQEEAMALAIPCLTLAEATERDLTLSAGTNTLVGTSPERILSAAKTVLDRPAPGSCSEPWDGRAGERAAQALLERSGAASPLAG
ncbi:MAG TPA: UDP-N-acetylglucosamine 2-epimerase (non-hydrolyzing) [Anaeromyxobacteraceae bacterium]|nr:UDP-N-acetylglucosamine 2-epimerase (non-hydrolyzing) [Anaeromyxobacteraceae bacterium]